MQFQTPSPEFFNRLTPLLGDSVSAFVDALNSSELNRGLRVNTGKISVDDFSRLSGFSMSKLSIPPEGFILREDLSVGRHPYHHAGLFYMQEPSAMLAAHALGVLPGMRVLDLCSAPGGKTGQLAAMLRGEGVLVANEIKADRARVLARNLERLGFGDVCILSLAPDMLAGFLPDYFDRVLVDAPCSGEAMFRREPQALEAWSVEHVRSCAVRQLLILESAADMLRPGGVLVYSTCAFSPEENEGVLNAFLGSRPEFSMEQLPQPLNTYLSSACPHAVGGKEEIALAGRAWPHLHAGEGQFIARLKKSDGMSLSKRRFTPAVRPVAMRSPTKEEWRVFTAFWNEQYNCPLPDEPVVVGGRLYIERNQASGVLPAIDERGVVRFALPAGDFRKGRFEPSHTLYMSSNAGDFRKYLSFAADSGDIRAFLSGATVAAPDVERGFCAVCVDGYPIGYGKISDGVLKNHYPKGLRT